MLSRYFYHGLNGQLCPEYFQKGPQNFVFFVVRSCSTVQYCTVLYSTVQYRTVLYSTVQYSTVLYSTVQYCTVQDLLFVIKKRKNQKRNTNGGGALIRGALRAPPVRVTFLIFLFFTDLGPCFGMNGHPRRATDMILRLSRSNNRCSNSFYRFQTLKQGQNNNFRRNSNFYMIFYKKINLFFDILC